MHDDIQRAVSRRGDGRFSPNFCSCGFEWDMKSEASPWAGCNLSPTIPSSVAYGNAVMHEYCKPGEMILKSGIYLVRHADGCEVDHEVTCIFGHVFPCCNKCGGDPQFSLVRYAQDVDGHVSFKAFAVETPLCTERAENHRKPWTRNDLAHLKSLLAEGKTKQEVADVLGRSVQAVNVQALKI